MEGLKKEFENLKMRFKKEVSRADNFDLPALFKDSLMLFERLKNELRTCKPEEKQNIIAMLAELQQFISSETRKIAEKSGMTEDQLARFAENPDNFSPEQWKSMQTVKEQLSKRGAELKKIIKDQQELDGSKTRKGTGSKKKPKITKKGWMRS